MSSPVILGNCHRVADRACGPARAHREAYGHVVAHCNNREFDFTTPEDFATVLAKLQGMIGDYEFALYAYTLMANHVHLLLQAPRAGALARPLRWFLTETARAFHRARQRRGHFWERRYRACLIEDDTYGLAALRYLDRNPVRAGLVQDPTTYLWSICAAYTSLPRKNHLN